MQKTLDRRQFVKSIGAAAAIAPSHSAAVMTEFGGLEYWSATELVAALANKRISSAELVEFVITRIEALDKHINAVVVRDFEHARAAAVAADTALARGERRPLLGLPMTVKETFNVHRLPTRWGDRMFQEWRPTGDALAVSRLKAAGAIILGKTNVPLMAEDWQSYNDIYGTTNNPWDLGRTPGGSSGGAAAALASGFTALELGADKGGSLRVPAHFCGVYAHKPSLDLVPLRGGLPPGSPQVPVRGDLAVAGPMARSAADLDLALGVIAGPDELSDGIAYRLALPAARHERLRDYRALVIDTHPLCPTAASIHVALGRLAERLSRSGCRISRASPLLPDVAETTGNYAELLAAERCDMPSDVYQRWQDFSKSFAPKSLQAHLARGLALTHSDWLLATRARVSLRERWNALFNEFDVLLCPVAPRTAFSHDHSVPKEQRKIDVDGKPIAYFEQIAWSGIATLNGLPATAAPLERSEGGLPMGFRSSVRF